MLWREEFRLNYFPHEEVRSIERGSYLELFTARTLSRKTLFTISLGSDSCGCISYEERENEGRGREGESRNGGGGMVIYVIVLEEQEK